MPAKKRARRGSRYFHGDDLTKKGLDRTRRSKSEPWEKAARARKRRKNSK